MIWDKRDEHEAERIADKRIEEMLIAAISGGLESHTVYEGEKIIEELLLCEPRRFKLVEIEGFLMHIQASEKRKKKRSG